MKDEEKDLAEIFKQLTGKKHRVKVDPREVERMMQEKPNVPLDSQGRK